MYLTLSKKNSILSILLMFFTLVKSQNFSLVQQNSIQVIVNNDTLVNPWTGGFNSAQISKIDFNNDQIEDLFVFDRSSDKVITFVSENNNFIYAPESVSYTHLTLPTKA